MASITVLYNIVPVQVDLYYNILLASGIVADTTGMRGRRVMRCGFDWGVCAHPCAEVSVSPQTQDHVLQGFLYACYPAPV